MINLLVLGGSGRTGIHVLRQAADRGHRVRALVRNPAAVQAPPGVEHIEATYPLDQIAGAHARSQAGHARGKLVIRL